MNEIGLNATRPEPARPPEAVATGLISDGDGGMLRPALAASSCQRRSRSSSIVSSGLIFLSGWRAIPGTIAATSQLDWLISMTAMRVLA